jgi:hypothetical protein
MTGVTESLSEFGENCGQKYQIWWASAHFLSNLGGKRLKNIISSIREMQPMAIPASKVCASREFARLLFSASSKKQGSARIGKNSIPARTFLLPFYV